MALLTPEPQFAAGLRCKGSEEMARRERRKERGARERQMKKSTRVSSVKEKDRSVCARRQTERDYVWTLENASKVRTSTDYRGRRR